MKVFGFVSGVALGMAAAAASVAAMYPDVPKRMKRDGRHIVRAAKRCSKRKRSAESKTFRR